MKEFLAALTYLGGAAIVHFSAIHQGWSNALNGIYFFWGVDLVLIGAKFILGIYPKKEDFPVTWVVVVINLIFQAIRAAIALMLMG